MPEFGTLRTVAAKKYSLTLMGSRSQNIKRPPVSLVMSSVLFESTSMCIIFLVEQVTHQSLALLWYPSLCEQIQVIRLYYDLPMTCSQEHQLATPLPTPTFLPSVIMIIPAAAYAGDQDSIFSATIHSRKYICNDETHAVEARGL